MSDGDPSLAQVRFVLVEPQSSGNIGSVARALKNVGFSHLRLVRPACDPHDAEARMFAVDAADLLLAATIHDDLDAALDGAGAVVGTSRRRGRQRRPHRSLESLASPLVEQAHVREIAVLFGREDSGLRDVELDRCTDLAYLPASDAYPSFNLSHAVLLVAHELARAARSSAEIEPPAPLAPHEQREAMLQHLESALLSIGFVHPGSQVAILRRIRRLLGRAGLETEDVRLLRGLARQIDWAAGQAGLPGPTAAPSSEPSDERD